MPFAELRRRRRRSATATTTSTCGSTTSVGGGLDLSRALQLRRPHALRAVFRARASRFVPGYGNTSCSAARRTSWSARLARLFAAPASTTRASPTTAWPARSFQDGQRHAASTNRSDCRSSPTNPRDFGLSFITVTGFSPLGHEYNNPQKSVTNTYQVLDTLTYARARTCSSSASTSAPSSRTPSATCSRAASLLTLHADWPYHRQRAGRSAAGLAAAHRRRAARQPAASAHRELQLLRQGQLPRHADADAVGRAALRVQLAAGGRRRPRQHLRSGDRHARSGRHERRAARRLRRRQEQLRAARRLGLDVGATRRRWFAAATASTTISRRSRPAKGSTSTRRTSTLRLLLPAAGPAAADALQSVPGQLRRFPRRRRRFAFERDLRHGRTCSTGT